MHVGYRRSREQVSLRDGGEFWSSFVSRPDICIYDQWGASIDVASS